MEHINNLYKDWLGAFAAVGMPAISRDTAARILAVVYIHGNNEALVCNKKFLEEIGHIKQMHHVDGGESPDAGIVVLIKQYVKELELYRDEHANDNSSSEAVFHCHAPEWAHRLFLERFGIKLIN